MNKNEIRKTLLKIRKEISKERREKASLSACFYLKKRFLNYPSILSFFPKDDEINIKELNKTLEKEKKLLLPRVENNNSLSIFFVKNQKTDLLYESHLKLFEPNPTKCKKMNYSEIEVILVPGIAFDLETSHRLGFGKGCYDRLLSHLPKAKKIGVGFLEQKISTLPFDANDIPLDEILLF